MAEKTKFQFNGQTYSVKGRLCHAIVKYYVEQHPNVTLKDLQKTFNSSANMIVATPDMALTVKDSAGKAGGNYYMKEIDIITIKNGQVVVWNYWPERFFEPFMKQVKALGMNVVCDANDSEETYLYHPGYEYDHDKFAEDIENEDTEGYEDDIWSIMSQVENDDEPVETVHSIDLSRPGIYIKDLNRRTYAYVFDGEIVWELD